MNKQTSVGALLRKLTRAAICLALCMVLPFLTGQIPQIGSALSPMHIPVLLGGFLCGPVWAAAVGFIAPLLRFALFGMPPIFPTGLAMSFELMVYGLVSGGLYACLPKRTGSIYASLLAAMLAGRIVWGVMMAKQRVNTLRYSTAKATLRSSTMVHSGSRRLPTRYRMVGVQSTAVYALGACLWIKSQRRSSTF